MYEYETVHADIGIDSWELLSLGRLPLVETQFTLQQTIQTYSFIFLSPDIWKTNPKITIAC